MSAKKIDLAKLFKDPKAIPDDFMIKLADGGEISFGDLRAYDEQRGGEIATEIKAQQASLAHDQAALKTASERVAQTYIDLEAEKKRVATLAAAAAVGGPTNIDPLAAYERDEVFGPVVKHFKTALTDQQKRLDDTLAKLDSTVKSIGQIGTTIMGDRARQDFESIMATDDPVRPKDLSLDALYKMAVERRIYDRNNIPDIRETYKLLTSDARHKHEVEEARKDERSKVAQEQADAAMMPLPSNVGPFGHRQPAENAPRNMNEAFSQAGGDRELFKEIHQPNLILGGTIQ